MKNLILTILLLIAATAPAQTPAEFAEKFVIYIQGSILVERETPEAIKSQGVKCPSYYTQDLLLAHMHAHLAKHPAARYQKAWRLNTDGQYEATIIYRTTPMIFQFNPKEKMLIIMWQHSF